MEIKRKICPSGLKTNPNRIMQPLFITIHCTGNYNAGATAKMHAELQYIGNGGRVASWHYTVDSAEIWQSYEDTAQCWHAGDGGGLGNAASIGIEICVNDKVGFVQACHNAAWLTAELMKRFNLPIGAVRQHFNWSCKNCPEELRHGKWGIDWNGFLKLVEEADEVVGKTNILYNGVVVEVERIFKNDTNYIKLRDLEKVGLKISYDADRKIPVVTK